MRRILVLLLMTIVLVVPTAVSAEESSGVTPDRLNDKAAVQLARKVASSDDPASVYLTLTDAE